MALSRHIHVDRPGGRAHGTSSLRRAPQNARCARSINPCATSARPIGILRPWGARVAQACLCIGLSLAALYSSSVWAVDEPAACQQVRFADTGEADVTGSTAVASTLLTQLGYQPTVTLLSVPVIFASMKNRDIDVFTGNWMPSQTAIRQRYEAEGAISVVRPLLEDASYTLATLDYAWAAGLRDFADIHTFAKALGHRLVGIEPGSPGNERLFKMVQRAQFGLGDFSVVESSEQGMLMEVERAARDHQPIVFLAWAPHPMHLKYPIRYLTGGDAIFGPHFGAATIYTVTRTQYARACPNVGRLLSQLHFSQHSLSAVMSAILERHLTPAAAAAEWLRDNPPLVAEWLAGVTDSHGQRVFTRPDHWRAASTPHSAEAFFTWKKIPVGDAAAAAMDYMKDHGAGTFAGVALVIRTLVNGLSAALTATPPLLLIGLMMLLAYGIRRSVTLAVFVGLALLFIRNQGYWTETMETLSLVLVSATVASAIGVPVGIAVAHRPRWYAILRPVLDLMQTLPAFVYLIPTLVLFGLGVVPGVISTVIFAMPAPIRLTQLGIASVPQALTELGQAFGATRWQLLLKVELPYAAPAIIAGLSQCIMLCLSMVVIAALVGAGGLGVPVVRALNNVQVNIGFEAGLAIVLLAVLLDRTLRPSDPKDRS